MKRCTLYQFHTLIINVLLIIFVNTQLSNLIIHFFSLSFYLTIIITYKKVTDSKTCTTTDKTVNGSCMLAANCFALNGKRIGRCINQFQIFVCCSLPDKIPSDQSIDNFILSQDHEKICGRNYIASRNSKIIGGQKSEKHEFPWQVAMFLWSDKKEQFKFHCGGSLLNKNWILTAAHCVNKKDPKTIALKIGIDDLFLDDGIYKSKLHEITTIKQYQHFNPKNFENDISLLRLKVPINYRRNIIPICLPKIERDLSNEIAIAIGWGRISERGPKSSQLMKVKLPIIGNNECMKMYQKSGLHENIPDSIFLCAGKENGNLDTCEGDSGSPLMTYNNNRYYVSGIVSWGIGCGAENRPGVYTKVTRYLSWITSVINSTE